MGQILLILGIILAIIGLFLIFDIRIPFLGQLPGDFYYKGKNFQFYFPLATSILISVILSLIFYFFRK